MLFFQPSRPFSCAMLGMPSHLEFTFGTLAGRRCCETVDMDDDFAPLTAASRRCCSANSLSATAEGSLTDRKPSRERGLPLFSAAAPVVSPSSFDRVDCSARVILERVGTSWAVAALSTPGRVASEARNGRAERSEEETSEERPMSSRSVLAMTTKGRVAASKACGQEWTMPRIGTWP